MTVKEHYDKHLGNFYSWMTGDFKEKEKAFADFIEDQKLLPFSSGYSIDLGAGHGIQSIALAKKGFKVVSIDFNDLLLDELKERAKGLNIEIVNDDIRNLKFFKERRPELIVCCGDTLTHLESLSEVKNLIDDIAGALIHKGKVVFSFRDYSLAKLGDVVNIPVKSDESRKLTCVLNYETDRVKVTDILEEKSAVDWEKKESSYYKVRIAPRIVIDYLTQSGFSILYNETINGMVTIIGIKN